jgi:hypothetical protein
MASVNRLIAFMWQRIGDRVGVDRFPDSFGWSSGTACLDTRNPAGFDEPAGTTAIWDRCRRLNGPRRRKDSMPRIPGPLGRLPDADFPCLRADGVQQRCPVPPGCRSCLGHGCLYPRGVCRQSRAVYRPRGHVGSSSWPVGTAPWPRRRVPGVAFGAAAYDWSRRSSTMSLKGAGVRCGIDGSGCGCV